MNNNPKNPLHGVTLEKMLTELHAHYGWEKLDACDGCALKKYCGGGGLSVPCAKKDKEGDA